VREAVVTNLLRGTFKKRDIAGTCRLRYTGGGWLPEEQPENRAVHKQQENPGPHETYIPR
jgi:hypothetical protein